MHRQTRGGDPERRGHDRKRKESSLRPCDARAKPAPDLDAISGISLAAPRAPSRSSISGERERSVHGDLRKVRLGWLHAARGKGVDRGVPFASRDVTRRPMPEVRRPAVESRRAGQPHLPPLRGRPRRLRPARLVHSLHESGPPWRRGCSQERHGPAGPPGRCCPRRGRASVHGAARDGGRRRHRNARLVPGSDQGGAHPHPAGRTELSGQ